MGGFQGSHPSHTGNKVMADAPRTSGSAPLSHRPVSQDVFFSEVCASTHQRPRLSTLLSPRRCSVTLREEAGRARSHEGTPAGWGVVLITCLDLTT